MSRQGGGRRDRKGEGRPLSSPLPVPLVLTTIGYATTDVTSHQGRGANVTQAGAHLFLITWEVSLTHLLLPFPLYAFIFNLFNWVFVLIRNKPGQAPFPILIAIPTSSSLYPSPRHTRGRDGSSGRAPTRDFPGSPLLYVCACVPSLSYPTLLPIPMPLFTLASQLRLLIQSPEVPGFCFVLRVTYSALRAGVLHLHLSSSPLLMN